MAKFGQFSVSRIPSLFRELSVGLYALSSENIAKRGITEDRLNIGGSFLLSGDGTQNDDIRIFVVAPDQIVLQRLVDFEWSTLQELSASSVGGDSYRAAIEPIEIPDGIITEFTLPNEYASNTLTVYLDGVAQDITEVSSTVFSLASAPGAGEEVRASYFTSDSYAGVAWGKILGTLSNQTDLQAALNAKVSTSGDESITGAKSFQNEILVASDRNTWVTSNAEAAIYRTSDGGSGIFGSAGNLIIQPRSSAVRDIILATGSGTPVEKLKIGTVITPSVDIVPATNNARKLGSNSLNYAEVHSRKYQSAGVIDIGTTASTGIIISTNSVERMVLGGTGNTTAISIRDNTTSNSSNVYINPSNGLLQRSTSSEKFKTDIVDIEKSKSEKVLDLRPVRFKSTAREDDPNQEHFGLVAEEVAQIDEALVHWNIDEKGEKFADGVQYERISVLLLGIVKDLEARVKALEAKIK